MYGDTHEQDHGSQPGKVATPARGKMNISLEFGLA